MTLTIKEYDKLYIRDVRDLSKRQISKTDASNLQSLIIDDAPVFKWGNRCLIAQQWVGVISFPEYSIEILPKLAAEKTTDECRAILTRMLLVANLSPMTKKLPAAANTQKNALSEVMIATFLTLLEHYVKNGLLSSYVKIQGNLDVVKGRLLFSKQFDRNVLSPTRFYCSYSKYIQDNALNQFFATCLKQMQFMSRDMENQRRIRSAISNFEGITSYDVQTVLARKIEFNSTNAVAAETYEYGKLFLTSNFLTISPGNIKMNVMLFDMNRLFEKFIFHCVRHIYGSKASYQSTGHYLLKNKRSGKKHIRLRPDILVRGNDLKGILIDTKWKMPKSFAKDVDTYQMNAYSTREPLNK